MLFPPHRGHGRWQPTCCLHSSTQEVADVVDFVMPLATTTSARSQLRDTILNRGEKHTFPGTPASLMETPTSSSSQIRRLSTAPRPYGCSLSLFRSPSDFGARHLRPSHQAGHTPEAQVESRQVRPVQATAVCRGPGVANSGEIVIDHFTSLCKPGRHCGASVPPARTSLHTLATWPFSLSKLFHRFTTSATQKVPPRSTSSAACVLSGTNLLENELVVESPGRHCGIRVPPAFRRCRSAGAVFRTSPRERRLGTRTSTFGRTDLRRSPFVKPTLGVGESQPTASGPG